MSVGTGTSTGHVPASVDPPVEDGEVLTIRSGAGQVADYIRGHRVVVDDGTSASRRVGWILIAGLLLAAVTLLISHLTFGPRDTYLPDLASAKQIPAILTVVCMLLIALFVAAATWHSISASPAAGRTFSAPMAMTTMFVVVINAFIGLSLLSTGALLRTRAEAFARTPSLVHIPLGDSDICVALGVVVVLACVLLLAISLFNPRRRGLAALLAGAPGVVCAGAYIAADRGVLALSDWTSANLLQFLQPDGIRFLVATPAAHIATSPLLVLVLASTAGIALLVTFGTVEFVDAKAKLSRGLLAGRQVSGRVLGCLVGAVAVAVIAGRFGWLPDGEGAVASFYKTAVDSWVLAAVFAAGGLLVLRSSKVRPLERRNPRVVVGAACLSLVAGSVMVFVTAFFQQLAAPFVDQESPVGRFIAVRLPSWSSWAQDWAAITVAAMLGVWGVYRLWIRHERSDRVVFAIAFGVVVVQLQLQIVADVRWASKDLWSFTAATPDQIALCAVALIAVAAAVKRPLLDNTTAALVVAVVFLVTLADAVVPNTFSANVFQLLLIAPFAYRFVFDSEDSHGDPRRGAITVAAIGLLFLAEAAAIAVGTLNSDSFEGNELSAFFQLTAPLALLLLCVTADPASVAGEGTTTTSVPDDDSAPIPDPVEPVRRRRRLAVTAVACAVTVFVAAALVFTVIHLPGKPDRGVYRVDMATIPATYTPRQELATADAEQVTLRTADTTSYILVHHGNTGTDTTLSQGCSNDAIAAVFGASPTVPLTTTETIAGMLAQTTTVTNDIGEFHVTCAAETERDGIAKLVIIGEVGQDGLSSDMTAIVDGLTFSATELA